jgi:hypothetical protein
MEWESTIKAPRWPAWLNATALLVFSWIVIASMSLQARAGAEIVAVAFPPWWGSQETISAAASAGAAIVRTTAIPTLLAPAQQAAGRFTFTRPSAEQLVLEGEMTGRRMRMVLRRYDHSSFRLVQNRFHWVQDYPVNR